MEDRKIPAPYEGLELMWIGGEWRGGRSARTGTDLDPWSGERLLELSFADVRDIDDAYEAARAAHPAWAASSPSVRAETMRTTAKIMHARRDEIAGWLIRETGSTLAKAQWECDYVERLLFEAASIPHHVEGRIMPSDIDGKESRVYRRPIGVVAVISPWNYPWWLSARAVAPALAVGNAVVLKPASDTPVTGGTLFAKVFEEAGLPLGVLEVVVGAGSEIGDALVQHPVPGAVSFTGSTGVGRALPMKAPLKRFGLELGGNAPLVVLDDADVGLAVDAAVFGSFFHQGQICVRANRLIVDHHVHQEFVERFVDRARELRLGDPSDPATHLGPVINQDQLDSVRDKVDRAVAAGGKLATGGGPGGPAGLSLPPHVILGSNDLPTAQEEVFGPVATIIPAESEEQALAMANDTEFGLSSAVFTQDADRGAQFALRVEAGMTHVNDSPANDDSNTAFGGEKGSGLGRFGGQWAVREFTTDHWVSIQRTPRKFPL